MHYFIPISLAFLLCSPIALAQGAPTSNNNSLFPQFSGISLPKKTVEKAPVPTTIDNKNETTKQIEEEDVFLEEENTSTIPTKTEEVDLFRPQVKPTAPENPSPVEEEKEEEETKDEKNQFIEIGISHIQNMLSPNRNMSFCTIVFSVKNTTKKILQNFSGEFTIGEFENKFNFSNLQKDQEKTEEFSLVGTACEHLLDPISPNINTCRVEDWSEKKCRSHIKIIPIMSK